MTQAFTQQTHAVLTASSRTQACEAGTVVTRSLSDGGTQQRGPVGERRGAGRLQSTLSTGSLPATPWVSSGLCVVCPEAALLLPPEHWEGVGDGDAAPADWELPEGRACARVPSSRDPSHPPFAHAHPRAGVCTHTHRHTRSPRRTLPAGPLQTRPYKVQDQLSSSPSALGLGHPGVGTRIGCQGLWGRKAVNQSPGFVELEG